MTNIARLWVGLIALATAALAHAAPGTRYVLLSSDGNKAGEQVVQRADDGEVTVRYVFKDNGRGPELSERFRLAPDGTLAEYAVTGLTTLNAPVDEVFTRSGDTAQWRSTSERGESRAGGGALYIPINGSFEVNSISIGVLAARPDGKLPLLPSGMLTQRVVAEAELTREGATQKLQLLAQTGLGLTPAFYWATTGAAPRLFAAIYPGWMSAIEEGWEANVPALLARQKVAEAVLLKDLAARHRQDLPGLTVLRNARVFDSERARLAAAASDIYVLRGRITAIVPAGSLAVKADGEIDAGGRVVLPGLFDMHGHVGRWEGGLHLAAGVTTVRDMGNDNTQMQQMLGELAAGDLLSPQLVPCGFLEGDSPFAARMGFVVKTLQEAKDAVDWYALHGYPQLKIYNSFPREHLRETVAHAHARGLRVSGHVPAFMRAQEVVEQGYDELQHINQVLLNFLVNPSTDTRTLERFYLPAEKLGAMDFDSAQVADFVALLQRHQTVIDPTVTTFDFIRQRDGVLSEPYAPIVGHLPPDVQRWFYQGGLKIPDDSTAARYRASYDKMVEFIGRMYRAGIPIVAGTDGFAGFTLQAELALYVKAGLTPAQALQVATRNGALYSGVGADRGSIAVGKRADLVLIDGDPTADIADLRKVAAVVTQGRLISPSAVYRALGVAPFVQAEPTLRTPTTARN